MEVPGSNRKYLKSTCKYQKLLEIPNITWQYYKLADITRKYNTLQTYNEVQ